MKYWIMKAEPSEFGIHDLATCGRVFWDGVRNYQVRNMFRDHMGAGDKALMYHSNAAEIGVVGEMEIVEPFKVDPTQFIKGHTYYDRGAKSENPRWYGPVVRYIRTLPRIVTLAQLKADERFHDIAFVKKGNRLSVTPISKDQYDAIVTLGEQTTSL